jgi:probable F420-dependent oxidoreductase
MEDSLWFQGENADASDAKRVSGFWGRNRLAPLCEHAAMSNAPHAALPQLSIPVMNFAAEPRDWQPLLDVVRIADEVGVDRVAVSDHILYGERLEAYADPKSGGIAGGKQPTGPDGLWMEPLTMLTMFAAQTSRVRLCTTILLAALRPAAVLAKQLATLDVLSGGRVDLGVGVGWQREEYEACGLDFASRGELLDRCVTVCRLLWTEQSVTYHEGGLTLENIHAMPKPAQAGGIPVWVSGRINPRTVRRVVEYGDGWIPWGDDIADPTPGIRRLRTALAEAGRDPSTLQVQGTLPLIMQDGVADVAATVAPVGELAAAGITDFRVGRRWGSDVPTDRVLLEELVPAFRAAAGRSD